jgi:hypothetical protein
MQRFSLMRPQVTCNGASTKIVEQLGGATMTSTIETIAAELGEVWEQIHRNDRTALAAGREGREERQAKLRAEADRLTARARVLEFRLSHLEPTTSREALILAALLHEHVTGLIPSAGPESAEEAARRTARNLVEGLSTAAGTTPAELGLRSYFGRRSAADDAPTAPIAEAALDALTAQWRAAKAAAPDALLCFRVGDFVELFFDDATIAAGVLGLPILSRGRRLGAEIIPMCGFPAGEQALDRIRQLEAAGHTVYLYPDH